MSFVRGARTFAGYQAVFCDKVADPRWRGLSAGAAGVLLELRLWADRSVTFTRGTGNAGKVLDEDAGFFWSVSRACEVLGERFAGESVAVAGWLVELRRGGFVSVDDADEVVVVDFVRDDVRKAGNVRRVDVRGGGVVGFSGDGGGEDMGGEWAGQDGRSHAPAGDVRARAEGGSRPSASAPPRLGVRVGLDCADRRGGKGGLSSQITDLGKQQTANPNPNSRFIKQPNQIPRAVAVGSDANANGEDLWGGAEADGREFYSQIWSPELLEACQWATRDYSPAFKNTFEKLLREHSEFVGDGELRQIAESVALDFRDRPETITAVNAVTKRKTGGPLFRFRVLNFVEKARSKKVGF